MCFTADAATTSGSGPTSAQAAEFEKRIEAIRRSEEGTRAATFARGAFRGKNVIIVQVEGLQAMLVGAKVEGKEVTAGSEKEPRQKCWWKYLTFRKFPPEISCGLR